MTQQEVTAALADMHMAITAPQLTLLDRHHMWDDLVYNTLSDLVALYDIYISIHGACHKVIASSSIVESWTISIRFSIDYEDKGIYEKIPVHLYARTKSLDDAENSIHDQLQQLVEKIQSRTVIPDYE